MRLQERVMSCRSVKCLIAAVHQSVLVILCFHFILFCTNRVQTYIFDFEHKALRLCSNTQLPHHTFPVHSFLPSFLPPSSFLFSFYFLFFSFLVLPFPNPLLLLLFPSIVTRTPTPQLHCFHQLLAVPYTTDRPTNLQTNRQTD